MNKQNFEAQDRFPLSTQALTFMQDMIMATARLALIGGERYILSGCTQTGNSVTDGIIVLDGEILPFRGGVAVETITVVEESMQISANGLTFPNARVKRHAQFATGEGVNYYPWSDFQRLSTNKQLEEAKATIRYVDNEIAKVQSGNIPTGVIVMWSGSISDIPKGWQLCDNSLIPGTDKRTPDLRGRFIVGYNNDDVDYSGIGNVGGAKNVALGIAEMPQHQHTVGIKIDGKGGGKNYFAVDYNAGSTQAVTSPNGGNANGNTEAHENRPPYYVLAFIIKIDVKQ